MSSGGRLRGALCLPLIYAWGLCATAVIALWALLCRRQFQRRGHKVIRWWGRVPLALLGIRLDVSGREHLATAGPKIVAFNHLSTLDLFTMSSLVPRHPLVLYKKELARIPGLGWALMATRMIPVARGDRERAVASILDAGRRIRDEGAAVLIAPEGTRSPDGRLGPFKMGLFHLAAATSIPVVPVIYHGTAKLLPMGSWCARPGSIRVEVLAPIDTTDWKEDTVRTHASMLESVFSERLAAPESVAG